VDQLQELFYNPLQFLTHNENKELFDILKEYCRSNAGCKFRPNLVGLIAAGLLITGATILIEYYLFIPAELALLPVIAAGGIVAPFAIGLEAILIVESLFLINFDVAYWVYVYRVQISSFDEDVKLNLNPLDGWGLN
jgi:hypothetical protein